MNAYISNCIRKATPMFLALVLILIAVGPVAAEPPGPSVVPMHGWGLYWNWSFIRENGALDLAVFAANDQNEPINDVSVTFEVLGVTRTFNIDQVQAKDQQWVRWTPPNLELPDVGTQITASVTMCVSGTCSAPTSRVLNDEREVDQGEPLSTRVKAKPCQISFKVEQDPDWQLHTGSGEFIDAGHLAAGEWSKWIDLSRFATYPASQLVLVLTATWPGHAAVNETHTMSASLMDCAVRPTETPTATPTPSQTPIPTPTGTPMPEEPRLMIEMALNCEIWEVGDGSGVGELTGSGVARSLGEAAGLSSDASPVFILTRAFPLDDSMWTLPPSHESYSFTSPFSSIRILVQELPSVD